VLLNTEVLASCGQAVCLCMHLDCTRAYVFVPVCAGLHVHRS
jgi:hypothetical protein